MEVSASVQNVDYETWLVVHCADGRPFSNNQLLPTDFFTSTYQLKIMLHLHPQFQYYLYSQRVDMRNMLRGLYSIFTAPVSIFQQIMGLINKLNSGISFPAFLT